MSKRIAIIIGHPDPAEARLGRGLAEAYARGAVSSGHQLRRIDLARLDVPFLRSQVDFETGSVPPSLREAQEAIAWAEHLVIVFPLWLGDMPAMLKAFLEQVLRPNFAFVYRSKGFPDKRLRGRSARVVITMGMPAFAYRWFYFGHALRLLKRNILGFTGIVPVRDRIFGTVGNASETTRQRWLAQMEADGRRGE